MAQADLFNNLMNKTGVWAQYLNDGVITTEKLLHLQEEMLTNELSISDIRSKMLKSDYNGLNVLKRMASSGKKILDQTKNIKDAKRGIFKTESQLYSIEKRLKKLNNGSPEHAALQKQAKALQVINQKNKIGLNQMRQTIPVLGKLGKFGMAISSGLASISGAIPIIGGILNGIIAIGKAIMDVFLFPLTKGFETFLKIQTTVGNLAADIGLTAKESNTLLRNMAGLSIEASKYGGTMEDVAKIMSKFSDTTGKNRIFNKDEIGQLIELGLGTGLGAEGAADIAASFDNIGTSLEKTINLTDKARGLAVKYNLNTTAVLKNYDGLVKSLTGIGFGKGLSNLTKLAAKALAIRFDIVKSTEAFKDAFFDPEKAVEASAIMQTLGGKFAASFGDPMQLAFESMSDPSALAEKFANTLSEIVKKDKNGEYFIPPADRKMLKIAAETLGQSYEDAVATAMEQKKIADKMVALAKNNFSFMGVKDEDRSAIAGLMKLDKNGEYVIKNSAGVDILLSQMTDKNGLNAILADRKKNEDAAIQRKNLMERLSLIVDRFMLGFSSVFTKLFGSQDFDSFLKMIENAGTQMATFINEKIMGSKGLATLLTDILTKGKSIFEKISTIFEGNGTFMEKIGSTLKVLFKDILVDVISFLLPVFKAGIGAMLQSIGSAAQQIPWMRGFGKNMMNSGIQMQLDAMQGGGSGNKAVSSLYKSIGGNNVQSDLANQKTSVGKGSIYDAAGKFIKTGANAKSFYGAAKTGKLIQGSAFKGLGAGAGMGSEYAIQAANIARTGNAWGGASGVIPEYFKFATKQGAEIGAKGASKAFTKALPFIGSLISAGFAVNDIIKGDFMGAGLQTLSAIASLFPGIGTGISVAIDGVDTAREMGAFDDGVIYKDGSYAKFGKGDMVNFIDQAAYEKATSTQNNNTGGGSITHSGTIRIESSDGKAVTWDQMYASRDLLGARIASINESYNGGFGNYQNSNISPIKPLL